MSGGNASSDWTDLAARLQRAQLRPVLASSSAAVSKSVAAQGRSSAPVISISIRGDRTAALAAAATEVSRQAALQNLTNLMVAPSSMSSQDSFVKTWLVFHDAWFGGSTPVLPLTEPKIFAICSMFRAGGYRSIDNYLSRIKDHHIGHGHPWSEFLHRAFRKAKRAVSRGIGPSRQSACLDLVAAYLALAAHEGRPVCKGGPVGLRSMLVCGCFWMMRELELSCARLCHLTVDPINLTVCWRLPASKTDVMALGKDRTWGCVCIEVGGSPCPVHAVLAQLTLLTELFGAVQVSNGSLPLFPSLAGGFVEKRHVVASLEHIATTLGEPLVDAQGSRRYGGHSLRVTGARTLAALGLSLPLIQLMARWSSDVVLRYVSEAPLVNMTAAYRQGFAAKALGAISPLSLLESSQIVHAPAEVAGSPPANVGVRIVPAKAYVLNIDSGVVHRPSVWDKEVQPASWRTQCGWPFGHANTATVPQLPSEADRICSGCFKAEKAEARANVLARSESASSSSSSSSPS